MSNPDLKARARAARDAAYLDRIPVTQIARRAGYTRNWMSTVLNGKRLSEDAVAAAEKAIREIASEKAAEPATP